MEIFSLIFEFSHSIEMSERILSCIAAARIIPVVSPRVGFLLYLDEKVGKK